MVDIAMIAYVGQPHAFRHRNNKTHNFVGKLRNLMMGWFQSIAAAALVVAILLFAAMAILVTIYAVLFLIAFSLSILGMA